MNGGFFDLDFIQVQSAIPCDSLSRGTGSISGSPMTDTASPAPSDVTESMQMSGSGDVTQSDGSVSRAQEDGSNSSFHVNQADNSDDGHQNRVPYVDPVCFCFALQDLQ